MVLQTDNRLAVLTRSDKAMQASPVIAMGNTTTHALPDYPLHSKHSALTRFSAGSDYV